MKVLTKAYRFARLQVGGTEVVPRKFEKSSQQLSPGTAVACGIDEVIYSKTGIVLVDNRSYGNAYLTSFRRE